ncbi:hypothetical protein [Pseudoalteromonas xiamenensis]|uniref:STAS/SEC14 domain-containing protein n=1 Tax=Pseudoalteromonas xiamenensis TaxID=882626 RepID=A0A975DIG4_9GAMM|nr:hypothetical protein [Pseudoalteromonas xiamenensis]QTH72154.1 hypothetical protein J5O05_04505 [Pseudoalteromonas xiamenensis]
MPHRERPFFYTTEFEKESLLLRAKATGHGKAEEVKQMFDVLTLIAKENNLTKLLINVEELTLDYSSEKMIDILYHIEQQHLDISIARIINQNEFKNDLIELFAEKHNLKIKNFTCEAPAIEWLNSQ